MKGLRLGRFFGIDVTVHWTFGLLLLWAGMMGAGPNGLGFVFMVALTIAAFVCVLLHEFGHSLTARLFGIETRGITLLPIGGVAQLERMPRRPSHELWITVAGPAVNLVLALLLWPLAALTQSLFLVWLVWVNVILLAFNLIPAFPMDGGRIFRALLAMRLPYARATHIAARVGQGLAVAYGLYSLFQFHLLGIVLALFIFGAATSERWAVLARERMRAGGFGVPTPGTGRFPAGDPRPGHPPRFPVQFVFVPPVSSAAGEDEPRWRNLTPDGPRDGS